MRHLIGVVLAIVMVAVLFFAGAWGYLRLTALTLPPSQLPGGGGSLLSDHGMLASLVAVAATGLLAGILAAVPRISPLAAGLPGLLLLGLTALYLVSVRHAVNLIPLRSHTYGTGLEAMLFHGILGAAGLAMIIPLFVPSRWRARRTAGSGMTEDSEDNSSLAEITGSQEPTEAFRYPEPADQAGATGPSPSFQYGQALPSGLPRRLPT
jgi:hypothetical protein